MIALYRYLNVHLIRQKYCYVILLQIHILVILNENENLLSDIGLRYSYTTVYCGLHERNTRECIHSRQWYN